MRIKNRTVPFILSVIFTVGLFGIFFTPMELGDVWWHLKTGQWIWDNQALPQADPFSISAFADRGVLSSFWLFQLIIYGLNSISGIYGLISLKAILFSLTFLTLNAILQDYGLSQPLRYILLLPAIFIATHYDEIRPQTVSFLFFALTFYLLEKRRTSGGFKPFYLLPAIMLLWSNMHAGYVSGVALIVLYASGDAIAWVFGLKQRMPTRSYLIYLLSILTSALNPNALKAVSWAWGMVLGSLKGAQEIHEHLSLIEFTSLTGQRNLYIAIAILSALGTLSFILSVLIARSRRPKQSHPDFLLLLLFLALGGTAFITFRAGMFFAVIASAFIGKNLGSVTPPRRVTRLIPKTALSVIFLIAIFFFVYPRTAFKNPALPESLLPVKVADFIKSERPPGNLFHPYEWGGYLMWRLYPEYRVFIDGRALGIMREYFDVLECAPSWKDILDRYDVNTVIYWPLLPYEGRVPGIVLCLLKDNSWSPVYWDLQSIVLVREEFAKHPIDKTYVWEFLTFLISANIKNSPSNPENYVALGELYIGRGMKDDGIEAFKSALALDPQNKSALFYIKALY